MQYIYAVILCSKHHSKGYWTEYIGTDKEAAEKAYNAVELYTATMETWLGGVHQSSKSK